MIAIYLLAIIGLFAISAGSANGGLVPNGN